MNKRNESVADEIWSEPGWKEQLTDGFNDLVKMVESLKEMEVGTRVTTSSELKKLQDDAAESLASFSKLLLSEIGKGSFRADAPKNPTEKRKAAIWGLHLTQGFFPDSPTCFSPPNEFWTCHGFAGELAEALFALEVGEVRPILTPAKGQQASRLERTYHELVALCWRHKLLDSAERGARTAARRVVADVYKVTPQTIDGWSKTSRKILGHWNVEFELTAALISPAKQIYSNVFGGAEMLSIEECASRYWEFRGTSHGKSV